MRSLVACLVVFGGIVAATLLGPDPSPRPAVVRTCITCTSRRRPPARRRLGKALTVRIRPPMPDHFVVLRHQEGDDWDYAVIQHLGPKADCRRPRRRPPDPRGPRRLAQRHVRQRSVVGGLHPRDGYRRVGRRRARLHPRLSSPVPGHRAQLERR